MMFNFLFSFGCFCLFSILTPNALFAVDTDVQQTLQNLLTYLTGPIAVVIATLAIVGLGFGCFVSGRISKTTFFSTFMGIALIFGASSVISMLTHGA